MLLLGVPGEEGDSGELAEHYPQAFSYPWGLWVHQQRPCPLTFPPTHQLLPQQSWFPMVLCLPGSPALFPPKEACAFPGSRFSFQQQLPGTLPVSDFNLTGWTLEATCWKDSQVTASSQRVKEHTRGPGESDLTFGIWSCFEKCQL